MRIVYVTASLPYGRGEAFVIPEMEELRRQGHQVLLVPVRPRGPVIHREAETFLSPASGRGLLSAPVLTTALAVMARTPRRVWRVFCTLLHSRNLRIMLKNLAVFPKGLWLSRLATQWGAEHIHAYWASTPASVAMIAGQISGIPWSFTAHRWDISENNLTAQKARSCSFCRSISAQGAEELSALFPPEAQPPVVIHLGVVLSPRDQHLPQSAPGTPPPGQPHLRTVMPANFVEKKGHRYLIEALGLLKEQGLTVTCDLAGAGELEKDLHALVDAAGLNDQVTFLGMLPHTELLTGLRQGRWQAVVLPSIETERGEKEGIPIALVEALGAGVPAVSTNTGAIAELLHGGAGLLVPQRDPRALANALRDLAENPALREQLAEVGQRRVREAYEIGAVVAQLTAAFQSAAAQVQR